jgi:alpha-L-rhamnosidase
MTSLHYYFFMTQKLTFRMKQVTILLSVGISLLLFSCSRQRNGVFVYDLRCENLTNPLGIGTPYPRFSWKTKSERNGTEQTAFQLLVSSDSSLLNEKSADLWNSGEVLSSAGFLIRYKGKNLNSRSIVYWKVRIWDETGKVTPWSSMAGFTVGLLDGKDWKSAYIGLPEEKDKPESPLLRSTFNISEPAQKLLLYVNSLGYHEVYINGKKVGNDVLSPAVSQFSKRSLAVAYDVSSCVRMGENDLVIWLGRGWYSKGLPGVVNEGPLVRAQLEELRSGNWETILTTNESWKGRMSEYSLIGTWRSGHYGGEKVDGSRIMGDWSSESLNKLTWLPVSQISVPQAEVSAEMVEPNRIQETIKSASVTTISDSTYLVDMGKNLTGWIKVNFPSLLKGQEIKMEYCDHLDSGGRFVDKGQMDIYVASGTGQESFINKFNYHGFRYVKISNLPKMPGDESVTAYLIHTDYKTASDFRCSDDDINRIHNMIFYTLRCLSLGGYLVDCPQIERLGYGGDGNASTETAQMMFDLAPLYTNWLQAWGDCIREDGGMPHTAPNPYPAGGGPYWCGFIISASWKTYLSYGDTLVLEKYYPAMQQWLKYVEKYSSSGILKRWPDTDYRDWYLGDWASPEGINEKSETSIDLVNNSFVCMCYDYMQKIARVLGKTGDIPIYAEKRDDLKKKVHEKFYDSANRSYADGNQIDMTFPLLAGIVPDSLVQKVTESLYAEIEKKHGGHIACGLVGIPVFTKWAVENQAKQLVYNMLKKKDYPGYLFMIENGATTTWENWKNSRSYIHNCFNGIGTWFYQAVGGIRMDTDFPAYRRVIIQPQIPDGIEWASATKETPYGLLSVNWKMKGSKCKMQLEIPVGVKAKVVMPDKAQKYRINGRSFGVRTGQTAIEVNSGKYDLSFVVRK